MDFGEKTILMILWSEFTTVVHSYCGSQFRVFAYVSDNKFILAMQQECDWATEFFRYKTKFTLLVSQVLLRKRWLAGDTPSKPAMISFFACLSFSVFKLKISRCVKHTMSSPFHKYCFQNSLSTLVEMSFYIIFTKITLLWEIVDFVYWFYSIVKRLIYEKFLFQGRTSLSASVTSTQIKKN